MAISWRTPVLDPKATASNTHTVTKPTGLANGDVVLIWMSTNGSLINSVPSGWTALATLTTTSNPKTYLYRKVITDAANEPAWTFGITASVTSGSICVAFTGVDTTTPEDTAVSTGTGTTGATAMTVPGVTTVTNGALLVYGASLNSSTNTQTPPTNMTEIAETGARKLEMAVQDWPTAGATGDRVGVNSTTNTAWNAVLVALRPTSGATGADGVTATDTLTVVGQSITGIGEDLSSATGTTVADTLTVTGRPVEGTGGPGGVYTPSVANWRWYSDAVDGSMVALAAENTAPTLTGAQMQNAIARLRLQVAETGGVAGTSQVYLDYSADGGASWKECQTDPETAGEEGTWFRVTNGAATAGATLASTRLTGSSVAGTYIETQGQTLSIGAGEVKEYDIAVKVHWPPPDTDIRFRLRIDTVLTATGGTQMAGSTPSLTTSTAADRPWTITRLDPGGLYKVSSEFRHSISQRMFYGNGRWWVAFFQTDTGTICRVYSWTGSGGWMLDSSPAFSENGRYGLNGIAFATINGVSVIHVSVGNATTTYGRRGVLNSDGTVTWGDEWSFAQANNGFRAATIDTGGYVWIGGANSSTGPWVRRSTNADTGSGWTAGFETAAQPGGTTSSQTGYGQGSPLGLVTLGSNDVMLLWYYTTTDVIRWSRVSGSTPTAPATAHASAVAHREDWGASRIGNFVYLVHKSGTADNASWALSVFNMSTNTWSAGTLPNNPSQSSGDDGLPVAAYPGGNAIFTVGSFTGPTETGADRVYTVFKYTFTTGSETSGTWSSEFTTPDARGNADHVNLPRYVGADGKLVMTVNFNDDEVTLHPRTLEYHPYQVYTVTEGTGITTPDSLMVTGHPVTGNDSVESVAQRTVQFITDLHIGKTGQGDLNVAAADINAIASQSAVLVSLGDNVDETGTNAAFDTWRSGIRSDFLFIAGNHDLTIQTLEDWEAYYGVNRYWYEDVGATVRVIGISADNNLDPDVLPQAAFDYLSARLAETTRNCIVVFHKPYQGLLGSTTSFNYAGPKASMDGLIAAYPHWRVLVAGHTHITWDGPGNPTQITVGGNSLVLCSPGAVARTTTMLVTLNPNGMVITYRDMAAGTTLKTSSFSYPANPGDADGVTSPDALTITGGSVQGWDVDVTLGITSPDTLAITGQSVTGTMIGLVYTEAILSRSDVIAYWRMQEIGTPTSVADDGPNNLPMTTVTNNPTFGEPGLVNTDDGTAATFVRASSQRVTRPAFQGDPLDLSGLTAFTVIAWVKPTTQTAGFHTIIGRAQGTAAVDRQWRLAQGANGVIRGSLYNATTNTAINRDGSASGTTLNVWQMVAFIRDGSSLYVYDKGVLFGPTTFTGDVMQPAGGTVAIGSLGVVEHWDGGIDEVSVHSTALTLADLQSLDASGRASGGLRGIGFAWPTQIVAAVASSPATLMALITVGADAANIPLPTTTAADVPLPAAEAGATALPGADAYPIDDAPATLVYMYPMERRSAKPFAEVFDVPNPSAMGIAIGVPGVILEETYDMHIDAFDVPFAHTIAYDIPDAPVGNGSDVADAPASLVFMYPLEA